MYLSMLIKVWPLTDIVWVNELQVILRSNQYRARWTSVLNIGLKDTDCLLSLLICALSSSNKTLNIDWGGLIHPILTWEIMRKWVAQKASWNGLAWTAWFMYHLLSHPFHQTSHDLLVSRKLISDPFENGYLRIGLFLRIAMLGTDFILISNFCTQMAISVPKYIKKSFYVISSETGCNHLRFLDEFGRLCGWRIRCPGRYVLRGAGWVTIFTIMDSYCSPRVPSLRY